MICDTDRHSVEPLGTTEASRRIARLFGEMENVSSFQSSSAFDQVATVNHQGTVLVFARSKSGAREIHFNVLDLEVGSTSDNEDWTGFRKLTFPGQLSPVGYSLIDVVDTDGEVLGEAKTFFQVVSDGDYVYVFRQSTKGTLLINRFVLRKKVLPEEPEASQFFLEPAWQVRFERSGKADVPANDKDTQSFRSPDGVPFVEPTLELSMVTSIQEGRFAVLFVPNQQVQGLNLQVFAHNSTTGAIDLFSLPMTENGLPSMVGKTIDANNQIEPDNSFRLQLEAGGTPQPLSFELGLSAVLYSKQERVRGENNESVLFKRSGRVMLAAPVRVGEILRVATLDFGVSSTGTLARMPPDPAIPEIAPANYTLEFDRHAFVELENTSGSLAIKSSFSIECYVYITSDLAEDETLLSGDPGEPAATAAPYIKLTKDLKIQVGFGDGTQDVSATTTDRVLALEAWLKIGVQYDTTVSSDNFTISVNGEEVPVTGGQQATPHGSAISQVSRQTGGLVGLVDNLVVSVLDGGQTTVVGHWPFDTVDDGVNPPTTPDVSENGNTGQLFGPRLVPSSAPIDSRSSGKLLIDDDGQTINAGVLDFAEVRSTPFLLDGSDGLIHLYFQGEEGLFDVAQYRTENARATFAAAWTATPTNDPTQSESGVVDFLANRSGSFMNRSEITITEGDWGLCDVVIDDKNGTVETWRGVARKLSSFVETLNGRTVGDPSNPLLKSGKLFYFDTAGTYPACRLPVPSQTANYYANFITRLVGKLPLWSIAVSDADASTCTVTLQWNPLRWNPDPKAPSEVIEQVWRGVSVTGNEFVETLNGLSTRYDYSPTDTTTSAAYAISAGFTESEQKNHEVIFFTRKTVTRFTITVAGSSASFCDVTVELDDGGTTKAARWQNVPRLQTEFAKVLEHQSTLYDYDKNASGSFVEIAGLILVLTDNLPGSVLNHDLGGPQPKVGMLAAASLFETFFDQALPERVDVRDHERIPAKILQEAFSESNGVRKFLGLGSELFGAIALTVPDSGAIAEVESTAQLQNGTANLVQNGIDGGWIRESPRKAIQLSGTNATKVGVADSKSEILAVAGDMSLEMWCQPEVRTVSEVQQPRLLTFNRKGNLDNPDVDFQYLAGLQDTACLEFGNETRIRGFYNLPADDGSCSFQTWVYVESVNAGTILFYGTAGVVQPYFVLSSDTSGKLSLTYGDGLASVQSTKRLETRAWQQLTGTLEENNETSEVTISLYIDGVLDQATTVAKGSFSNIIGTFDVGSFSQAVAMQANGVCLWDRTISATEVGRDFGRDVPNNDDGLVVKWYLTEGQGTLVANAADAGIEFSSDIGNPPTDPWRNSGVYYKPFVANADFGLMATDKPLLGGWRHLAMVYRSGYAIELSGNAFANCGNSASLNVDNSLSLEAWFQVRRLGQMQALVSKPGTYEIVLYPDNSLRFRVWTSLQDQPLELKSTTRVKAGEPYYVAVTYGTAAQEQTSSSQDPVYQKYLVQGGLHVNGILETSFPEELYDDPVTTENGDANLNLGRDSNDFAYLDGFLSDVRVWNRRLTSAEIQEVSTFHLPPANRDGLVSYWRFSEMEGKVAFDTNGVNNAILSSNQLWSLYRPVSAMDLYVDGDLARVERIQPEDYGGYGEPQFVIGAQGDGETAFQHGFEGEIDEVRTWRTALTREQLTDSMYRTLSGKEANLVGYWRFDTGSGTTIDDRTGHGNDGELLPAGGPPQWVTSRAPLSNEAQVVYNVLGGVRTFFQERITGPPAVVEYADLQRDAEGRVFSVMKRCYVSPMAAFVSLLAGYKVGDLDTVYVGQVQTRPTLIGYIEGAPPIPSENQTMPFWAGDVSEYLIYAEATSVTLNQASESSKVFTSSKTTGDSYDVSAGVGVFFATSSDVSFGLGAETGWQTWAFEGRLGFQAEGSGASKSSEELAYGFGKPKTLSDTLTPGGRWEDEAHVLNPEVGRRFIPDNVGYALVKSLTADLYASVLRGTSTVVRYTTVPNTDIPEDVNVIDFPIDPRYVKNGTLDGMVGLENDPDYPDADFNRGSYFRPIEAYALKREIERQDQQIEAYYEQYEVEDFNDTTDGLDGFRSRSFEKNPSYDWSKRLARRSLVNTYVWTAGGGLHAEEESLMDTYSESFGALTEVSSAAGLRFDLSAAFVVGLYTELDALFGSSIEVTSVRSGENSDSYSLASSAKPDWFLKRPILDDGELQGYTRDDAPGKVDGYRYMSFFLPPSQTNSESFESVIDQNWLANSMQPNAVALREATTDPNGAWRVLHRVTYVSRVPPQFQPVPGQTLAPDVTWPANLASNTVLTRLVEKQLPTNGVSKTPSPVEIGAAVRAVLGESKADPGILGEVLPWWGGFLEQAQDNRSRAYKTLAELRVDLLDYMVQKLDAEGFAKE